VFLSYASEDARSAERIANTLRNAGIEVWFDREELRGGDVWDQKIRQQIHDCRLFLPIISAQSEARLEAYFRREWKLAVDRTDNMASEVPFLLPVVIDDTANAVAHVPERFHHVQWTRLPGGETPLAFAERVRRLLSQEPAGAGAGARQSHPAATLTAARTVPVPSLRSKSGLWTAAAVLLIALALGGVFLWHDSGTRHLAGQPVAGTGINATQGGGEKLGEAEPAAPPPPASIAVLAFSDLSPEGNQAYFADGIAEEILNMLARVRPLKVVSRTSSFQFRKTDLGAAVIARRLGVRSLLEGSVRKSGQTFRIDAELVDGQSGFTQWANRFDRPIDNIFAVQGEIAGAVVGALTHEVHQTGDSAAAPPPEPVNAGGTHSIAAFDAYLRGRAAYNVSVGETSDRQALAEFEAAIAADPRFAAAHAGRSRALVVIANQYADAAHTAGTYDQAIQAARTATTLAPDLADAQSALAFALFQGRLDIRGAREPYELSRALGEGDGTVMGRYALYCADTGRAEEAEAAMRRALELDPLNPLIHRAMGSVLYAAHRYADVIPHVNRALAMNPKLSGAHAAIGNALLMLGRTREAREAFLAEPHRLVRLTGLAITEKALGNKSAARKALDSLVSQLGDSALYQQAEVRAQWHDIDGALTLLRRARELGDSGLVFARTDPLLEPLRRRPEFGELLRQLGFD
jgi:TolB-like protein/tetratricopeptide (TPR) repeat protein